MIYLHITLIFGILIQDNLALSGYPYFPNCFEDRKESQKNPHLLTQTYILTPEWSDEAEKQENPLLSYTWSYEAEKELDSGGSSRTNKYSLSKFQKNISLAIPAYELDPGGYLIYPKAKRKDTYHKYLAFGLVCHLYIVGVKPQAIIKGGTERLAPADEPIYLSASDSRDLNHHPATSKTLKAKWESVVKKSTGESTNLKLDPEMEVTIDGDLVSPDSNIIVTLTVTSMRNPGVTASAEQNIKVVRHIALLNIRCIKNCPGKDGEPNFRKATKFAVECKKNCDYFGVTDYEWDIKPRDNIDFSRDTSGLHADHLNVKANVFQAKEYEIIVQVKAKNCKGTTSMKILFVTPPQIDCQIDPNQGKSLIDDFILKCKEPDDTKGKNYRYELRALRKENKKDWKKGFIITSYFSNETQHPFKLPPSETNLYVVRKSVDEGPYNEIELSANVMGNVKGLSSSAVAAFIKKHYYGDGGISHLIKNADPKLRQFGYQKLHALIDELIPFNTTEDPDMKHLIQELKYSVIDDMLKSPMQKYDEFMRSIDVVADLMVINKSNDPTLGRFSSALCKKMAERHLNILKNEPNPSDFSEKSRELTEAMSNCLSSSTVEPNNYDLFQPKPFGPPNISTENLIINKNEPAITENYENYVDFTEEQYKHMENLKESTFIMINTTATSAKLMAITAELGEDLNKIESGDSVIAIVKDKGKNLVKRKMLFNGLGLTLSRDFVNDEHPYDVLVSMWTKDILWWNPKHIRTATDTANIEIFHSTCKERVSKFKSPNKIILHVKKERLLEDILIELKIEVPQSGKDLNKYISVHRVTLPMRWGLRVKFYNLSENDVLDVTFTKFKFPSFEDFALNNKTVSKKSDFLLYPNTENYNYWCYVAILPNKQTVSNLVFNVSFTASCCMTWREKNDVWTPDCTPVNVGSYASIGCECEHLSVIAGYLQGIESVPQFVIEPELELELQSIKVIFTTVTIIFAIYCTLIILTIWPFKKEIYYLADNLPHYRFTYAVVTKTSCRRGSGTTSNVMIKITGTKGSSDSHVLNYPDPRKRTLQRSSQDIFILTTGRHLGDLIKIELWTDCLGTDPSWFCTYIDIFDLQQHTEWRFNVREGFSVINDKIRIVAFAANKSLPVKIINRIKFCDQFHSWLFLYREKNVSPLKKLTIILSTVLTTNLIILLLFGLPSLELKDVLDKGYPFRIYEVLIAFLGSFISFLIHITIIWVFRYSKIQFSKRPQIIKKLFQVTTLLCWGIIIMLIVISMVVLIFCGFWVPYSKSLQWLKCCIIGLIFDILIYENVFINMKNLYWKSEKIHSVWDKLDQIWREIESQRMYLYKKFGNLILRPYFQHLYRPITKIRIKEKKLMLLQRQNIIAEMEDLLMFGVYFVILYVVILANKDRFMIYSKQEMYNLVQGKQTNTQNFSFTSTISDFYDYINFTLIPTIQPLTWYGKYAIENPGMMKDINNKYIGVVRFRQHRTKTHVCNVPKIMKFLNKSCWPEFSSDHNEIGTFSHGWAGFSYYLQFDRLRNMWRYTNQHKSGTIGSIGQIATYSGGGYITYLGRTFYNSYANFDIVVNKFWIDRKTRSIFLEFLTYNANYNVFNAVRLLLERSASGLIFTTVEIYPARMLFVQNETALITGSFFVLFILWVLILFFKQSLSLIKKIRTCYKDVWFLVDISIILMSVVCIVMFFVRSRMVGNYLHTLEKTKHNEFINYFYLFYLEDFLQTFGAVLICIATIRLWKFLRFGMMFRVMEKTLVMSAIPLLSVLLTMVVIVMTFSLTGVLLFGNEFSDINTIFHTFRILIMMTLKPNELNTNKIAKLFKSAYLFFSVYLILVQILLCIYIVVIIMAYSSAQIELSTEISTYNIHSYVEEQVLYLPKFLKYKFGRLQGGQEEYKNVKRKPDDLVHANAISIDSKKIYRMKLIARCVMRNLTQSLTDKNNFKKREDLMLEVCRQFIFDTESGGKIDLFFKGRVAGKRITIVDERKIAKVANAVELMLKENMILSQIPHDETMEECVQIIKKTETILHRCSLLLMLILHKVNLIKLSSLL